MNGYERNEERDELAPFEELPVEPICDIIYDPIGQLEMEMDVRTTIDSLPRTEKGICMMLLNGENVAAICERLKITRSRFFKRHLSFIRTRFEEYGFDRNEINFEI